MRIRIGYELVYECPQPTPMIFALRRHGRGASTGGHELFLLGSRYCETDRLSDTAWQLFGHSPTDGGARRPATMFTATSPSATNHARSTKTAWEALQERTGVCRDYAHLAVAFCRCLNIPARYCTGYLPDIGVPPPHSPMDFARGAPGQVRARVVAARYHVERNHQGLDNKPITTTPLAATPANDNSPGRPP
jgi:transglutaminase-like putative cysteine protease